MPDSKLPNDHGEGPANPVDWVAIKANARIFADVIIDEMAPLFPVQHASQRSMIRATINVASFQIAGPNRDALLSFIVDLLNIDSENDYFLYQLDDGNIESIPMVQPKEDRQ